MDSDSERWRGEAFGEGLIPMVAWGEGRTLTLFVCVYFVFILYELAPWLGL